MVALVSHCFIEILFVPQKICYCDSFNSKVKQKNENIISIVEIIFQFFSPSATIYYHT